jgi:hypothetical protein
VNPETQRDLLHGLLGVEGNDRLGLYLRIGRVSSCRRGKTTEPVAALTNRVCTKRLFPRSVNTISSNAESFGGHLSSLDPMKRLDDLSLNLRSHTLVLPR